MSLSVIDAPDGFRPVGGGSLVYIFQESDLTGKTNYRVVLTFDGLGSTEYEFRPDATGRVEADIAPILRSHLTLSADVADRLKNTYVTYQAVWNESEDAAVPLSSDVIYFYIGNNHYLNSRSKFHTTATDGQSGPTFAGDYPAGVHLH